MTHVQKISVCCAALAMLPADLAGANPEEMRAFLPKLIREAAAEGAVLLKNDGGALPLDAGRRVAVFGRVQVDTFHCGNGSGGEVRAPYRISILEGLRANPNIRVDEELAAFYEAWTRDNPAEEGTWGNWPRFHPEMPLIPEIAARFAERNDTALVVIGRAAGEERECLLEEGSYFLTQEERAMLKTVSAAFRRVVVLLNIGNIMDMSWIEEFDPDAVLLVWQGGMEAGSAVADLLSGDVSPSGKLAATIARSCEDWPSARDFGGKEFNNYSEDVFVGWRWFETFAPDRVLYPFGFGLSYADFEIQGDAEEKDGIVLVRATVTNVSKNRRGKEVVQVYCGAPNGVLGKPAKSLAAYAKTRELAPGERQTLRFSFPAANLASYDDAGRTGHPFAWVLEPGEYPIFLGASVRDARAVGSFRISELRVVERLAEACPVPDESVAYERIAAREENGRIVPARERVPVARRSLRARVEAGLPHAVEPTGDKGIKLIDVRRGKASLDDFIAQLSPEELAALTRGDFKMHSPLGVPGNAAVYGGVTESLRAKGVPPVSTADGPSGLRLDALASLLPVGTLLACTWNDPLVERLYFALGGEMRANNVDVLLAPGMNIQRNPLCGRNFEYFSEDPLLTGRMGANVVRGVQSAGCAATPKHFALNNQETERFTNDSRCSERAMREIYLRGFEIVAKTAKPYGIMGCYNRVNGVCGYGCYDLCTTILREQWGWDGMLMTDWWTRREESRELAAADNALRVRAQTDLLMPGEGPSENDRSLLDSCERWAAAGMPRSLDAGITLGEMQRCARNVLKNTMRTRIFCDKYGVPDDYRPGEPWFRVETLSERGEKPSAEDAEDETEDDAMTPESAPEE